MVSFSTERPKKCNVLPVQGITIFTDSKGINMTRSLLTEPEKAQDVSKLNFTLLKKSLLPPTTPSATPVG